MSIRSSEQQQRDPGIFAAPVWYQALTLTERMAYLPADQRSNDAFQPLDPDRAMRRLQHWKAQEPFQEERHWRTRLALAGISEAALQYMLGTPGARLSVSQIPTPPWLATLQAIYDYQLAHADDLLASTDLDHAQHYPFYTLVSYASAQLLIKVTEHTLSVTPAVSPRPFLTEPLVAQMAQHLSRQLVQLSTRVLALEVNIARLQGRLTAATPEQRYQEFVAQLNRAEHLWDLFTEYPVWARLLAETVQRWIQTSAEFWQHLHLDWDDLCMTFGIAIEDTVCAVEQGAGDSHRGGRSVTIVQCQSGTKVVYKPRSVAIDGHFQELLAWLNQYGDHPPFYTTKMVDKTDHGWIEFIKVQSCTTQDEIVRFYQRQGGYLALLYLLQANDFHSENLIAMGEHPVLIDLETLFHQSVYQPTENTTPATLTALHESVLSSGLLPYRMNQERGDVSGLGHAGVQRFAPILAVIDGGTDTMHMRRQWGELPPSQNRPALPDQTIHLHDYLEPIIIGFTSIYRLLQTHRTMVECDLLPRFADAHVRIIVRPTQFYGSLLNESTHPQLLRDALDREQCLDHLWHNVRQLPEYVALIPHEQQDLLQGDTPLFTTHGDSCHLYASSGVCIPNMFAQSGLALVVQTLHRLSDQDLERQQWCITVMLADPSSARVKPSRSNESTQGHMVAPAPPATHHQSPLMSAAIDIAVRLEYLAIPEANGVNWLYATPLDQHGLTIMPCGLDLYDGLPGIGLFFAYLAMLTGSEHYRNMARTIAETVQDSVAQKDHLSQLSIGTFNGVGGLVYYFTHLSALWDDSELYKLAMDLVEPSQPHIAADSAFDVIGGVAGYILALLSLYKRSADPAVLAAATAAGEHLVAHAQSMPVGAGWLTIPDQHVPVTGFGHGTAGIALSLAMLATYTGQDQFQQVAYQALAYERQMFSPTHRNWPDLRGVDQLTAIDEHATHVMTAWCYGAPGIGMGRLAALPYLGDDPMIQEEITVAIETTLAEGMELNHSLCHGALGNLDLLVAAAHDLGEPQYLAQLDQCATQVLGYIEKQGWRSGIRPEVETPGLMVGLAGIGYQLLRLAEPEKVPSVLVLEPPR